MVDLQKLHARIGSRVNKLNGIHDIYLRAEEALTAEINGIDWSQMRSKDAGGYTGSHLNY